MVGLSASNKGDEGRRESLGVDVREQVSRWIADDEDGLVVGFFGTMCFLLCDFLLDYHLSFSIAERAKGARDNVTIVRPDSST